MKIGAPYTAAMRGEAEIGFALAGCRTRLAHLHQRSPLRVLFPQGEPDEGAALAVLLTTSGGLVAGDRITVSVTAGAGAVAHVTTAAAEKAYGSRGATTDISQTVEIRDGAWIEYLPQETILFDGARLRRHTRVMLAPGGGFLGGGITVFGRRARGERFEAGLLHEQLEIYRDGALVWGDALHLDGPVSQIMADPACFDGAAACATVVLVPRDGDPGRFVDDARAAQNRHAAAGLRAGVSVVNGVFVARWLAADPLPLRGAFVDVAGRLRVAAAGLPARLPRLWHI